jgi:hypothetical protein
MFAAASRQIAGQATLLQVLPSTQYLEKQP